MASLSLIFLMDVIFEPQKRTPFTIEVGFFDTVLEIKEKVQKYHGIPISKQTLIFNGHVLQDDHDVERCILLHNSHVQLLVAPDSDTQQAVTTDERDLSPSIKKIQLSLKIPSLSKMQVPVEMELNDSVLKLKEKLQEMEGIPVNNLVLKDPTGVELQDHKSLNEYHELIDGSEIHVGFKTLPTGSSAAMTTTSTTATATTAAVSTGAGGCKKLKLLVLPMGGTKKIPVEMNANDNVGELRKELQKLQEKLQFHIPQEGYFFIYKQNVMDDDRSFRWHHVSNGETIEIFNGSISGGS